MSVTQQKIERAAEVLLSSAIGRALDLRPVEARKIAEIVLNAEEVPA